MDRPETQVLVRFEDTHLIVVEKPAGLLSQGEHTGDENLVDYLRQRFGRNYVGLVHRLDRNTSGLMVVAKRTKSAQRLTDALQAGKIFRAYHAWLRGKIEGPLKWRHYLEKNERDNRTRVHSAPHSGAKEAVLLLTPLAHHVWNGSELTLAELVLETGRSHQIRAQAAFQGHALLGDVKYGKKTDASSDQNFGRPALHSARLEFPHPMSGELMKFISELPPDLRSISAGSATL